MAQLFLDSLPSVIKIKRGKILAVEFWVGSEGGETVQFDFTVCGFKTTAAVRHNRILD